MYTVTIDWLSFTLHPKKDEEFHVLQLLSPDGVGVPEHPKFGYDRCWRTEKGALILSSASNRDMGIHCIISGSALVSYQSDGPSPIELVVEAVRIGAKITRLDLAKDATNATFGLPDFERGVSDGRFEGTSHKAASVKSSDGGMTVYVGSRQSEQFLRVYDKGIESKQGGDWVRAEIELKGDRANLVGKLIAGGEDLNNLFCSMARRMCRMEHKGWNELLEASALVGLPKIEKQSDRERWIAAQVTPAVSEYASEHPESAALRRLYEVLKQVMDDQGRAATGEE